jgi:hypothetical protein
MLLGLALLVRLAVAPFAYGFQYDMDTFGSWAQALVGHPFDEFYAVAPSPDHLPGDLYLHFGLASGFQAFGGENFHGEAYRYLLKVVPAMADILVAVLIWAFVRRRVNEESARAGALLYAMNPATIFLSSIWGQWDVVSGLIMLAGLIIVWAFPSRWLFAIPLLAWAVVIKPPLALLCVLGLLPLLLRDLRRGTSVLGVLRERLVSLLAAVVIGIGTVIALILPFDTGLPGMGTRWSLLERLDVAVELYPFTTLGAANIWMIPLGTPDRKSDVAEAFLGLSAQGWGNFLFLAALLFVGIVLVTRWRTITPFKLVTWAMVLANYAYFLLPTRSHERYMFPAVMLLILLAALCGIERRVTWLAVAVSATYFLNLLGVYGVFPGMLAPMMFVTLSLMNIALFVLVATFPFWWVGDGDDEAEVVGTPMPVYADDYVTEMIPSS